MPAHPVLLAGEIMECELCGHPHWRATRDANADDRRDAAGWEGVGDVPDPAPDTEIRCVACGWGMFVVRRSGEVVLEWGSAPVRPEHLRRSGPGTAER